ncbi:MAG TPA: lysylphosphatidylglycerol synthase domain-containing protein [Vicinamibacterales bacterium]|nr:lysylphosphatidylglycerol synthase domain-containing protein [Vicinamibacterales bacterium]
MTRGRLRAVAVAAGIGGAALFVWSLKTVGVAAVAEAMARLGAGFIVIVALGGVRHLVRASAWRLCFDDPRALPLGWSVAAYVSGDAVGNVTPFGIFASEPSKIVLLRHRLAAGEAIPALALENLFYGLTVVAMLAAGTGALLLAFDVTTQVRTAALLIVGGVAGALVAATIAARWMPRLVVPLVAFVARHRERLWAIGALEIAYHVSAVFEIWIAVALITGTPPTLLVAFVLEYVNRTITVVFQFVPMWLGVDEAGTGLMASALGLTGATGVALALARKARIAVWTAVGLLLLSAFRLAPHAPAPPSWPPPSPARE